MYLYTKTVTDTPCQMCRTFHGPSASYHSLRY